jgi:hypothetical protein
MNDVCYQQFLNDIENEEIEQIMEEMFAEESFNEMFDNERSLRGY